MVALGAATGSLAWGLAAAFGLASLLVRYPTAFDIIRIAGATYLALLGIWTIWHAGSVDLSDSTDPPARRYTWWRAYGIGLGADLLNPKMGVFYLAIIPQFIPTTSNIFTWSMLLMAIEFTVAVACLTTYALLASSARQLLTKTRTVTWIERVFGLCLIGFGVRVAIT
jgi:threonine/homoserine/homoserine lactone efflux protein